MRTETPDRPTPLMLICSVCGRGIDCCEFCDETDCGTAICFRCLSLALGRALPHPHPHGG